MNPLLALLKRPLLYVAGQSFFVNLLLVPSPFMLQLFVGVLSSQSNNTLLVPVEQLVGNWRVPTRQPARQRLHLRPAARPVTSYRPPWPGGR